MSFQFQAVDAAVKALKAGSVSSADLARGKEQLKLALLEEVETSSGLVANLGQQALLTGFVPNPAEVVAAIDALPMLMLYVTFCIRP